MKWNAFLLISSIVMLLFFVGAGLAEHMMQAEAIAEQLAPQIRIEEDILRIHLEKILRSGTIRRTIVYCSPLALITVLLTVRLIVDVVREHRHRC